MGSDLEEEGCGHEGEGEVEVYEKDADDEDGEGQCGGDACEDGERDGEDEDGRDGQDVDGIEDAHLRWSFAVAVTAAAVNGKFVIEWEAELNGKRRYANRLKAVRARRPDQYMNMMVSMM